MWRLRGRACLLVTISAVTCLTYVLYTSSNTAIVSEQKWTHHRGWHFPPLSSRPATEKVVQQKRSGRKNDTLLVSRMMDKGQMQQLRVAAFCSKHHRSKPKNIFPVRKDQRQQLFRHLIYDVRQRFIFCFVEKVGCTNMKRLLFVNMGVIPKETIGWSWVDSKTFLDRGLRKTSFTSPNLTVSLKKAMVYQYYKVMFVRNPLERLISAYRNKIEPPLNTLSKRFPNYLKREILETYQPLEYQAWLKSNASYGLNVSFPDFVRYLIDTPNPELNPHLRPQIHICHPCRIRYSFYGNFKTISEDAAMVIQKIHAKPEYYPDRSLHTNATQTKNYLLKYYSQLSPELSYKLFKDWLEELDFYYHLYPEEKESHKKLLRVNEDVL